MSSVGRRSDPPGLTRLHQVDEHVTLHYGARSSGLSTRARAPRLPSQKGVYKTAAHEKWGRYLAHSCGILCHRRDVASIARLNKESGEVHRHTGGES